MAAAFTQQEEAIILDQLQRAARESAVSLGVRRATVDALAAAAGISKGAFYKFYASKELLFLDVLENMHAEIYGEAASVLSGNTYLSPADRAFEAILSACRAMERSGMMAFVERDAAYLLRKVPEDYQKNHYHSDEVHIRELLESAGLVPAGGMALASAVVRGLMLTISHQHEIGGLYPNVLEILVRGACRQLFS
ncbi:TetR/AcrR family transcriptional regulator [Oscillibacter sp. GMB15532]|uniref:TetR/AcrR family transcriptional regulator n=1 Tax=Oscillibacter sp. GMB15532 TaxID=3230022 RepID=UPI0034DE2569